MARTLSQKLGWKPGTATLIAGCPEGVTGLPAGDDPEAAFVLVFVRSAQEVEAAARVFAPRYREGGWRWFAYPKASGRIGSDINRDHGWERIHTLDLLPVTQVAIDADWSALRFRRRSEIPRLTRRF